jgi:hypothetical protein
MALTYTAEQVINKAASDLGKLVPGEALGAVEHDIISDRLDNVLTEISRIIAIADRDEIPALAFESVAVLTAMHAASEFSNTPLNPDAVERVEQRLRVLIAQTPTYEPVAANYF